MTSITTKYIPAEVYTSSGYVTSTSGYVNGEALAAAIETECNSLVAEGYSILDVKLVTSGADNFKNGLGYGFGVSFTSGAIIIAEK